MMNARVLLAAVGASALSLGVGSAGYVWAQPGTPAPTQPSNPGTPAPQQPTQPRTPNNPQQPVNPRQPNQTNPNQNGPTNNPQNPRNPSQTPNSPNNPRNDPQNPAVPDQNNPGLNTRTDQPVVDPNSPNVANPNQPFLPANTTTQTTPGIAPGTSTGSRYQRPFAFQSPQSEAAFNTYQQRLARMEMRMQTSNQDLLRKLGEARSLSGERQSAAMADVMQQILRNQALLQQYLVQARTSFTGEMDTSGINQSDLTDDVFFPANTSNPGFETPILPNRPGQPVREQSPNGTNGTQGTNGTPSGPNNLANPISLPDSSGTTTPRNTNGPR